MSREPSISFGPFFSRAPKSPAPQRFVAAGCQVEFAGSGASLVAPVYRRVYERSPDYMFGFDSFYIPAVHIPWSFRYTAYDAEETSAGLFCRVEFILDFIYRNFEVVRGIPELLTEFRDMVGPTAPVEAHELRGLLRPELDAAGFRVDSIHAFVVDIFVGLQWTPLKDIKAKYSSAATSVGGLQFRPRPNKTLGPTKIHGTKSELQLRLRRELREIYAGPWAGVLSPSGVAKCLEEFVWTKCKLMTRKQVEEARCQFLKDHVEMLVDPPKLARLMIKEGLFTETTIPSTVVKALPKLREKAGL